MLQRSVACTYLVYAIPEKELLRYYCQRNFGSLPMTFEFPWFGRTPDDMRATGRKALWALLRALDPATQKST
jgi:hypothetical protein